MFAQPGGSIGDHLAHRPSGPPTQGGRHGRVVGKVPSDVAWPCLWHRIDRDRTLGDALAETSQFREGHRVLRTTAGVVDFAPRATETT